MHAARPGRPLLAAWIRRLDARWQPCRRSSGVDGESRVRHLIEWVADAPRSFAAELPLPNRHYRRRRQLPPSGSSGSAPGRWLASRACGSSPWSLPRRELPYAHGHTNLGSNGVDTTMGRSRTPLRPLLAMLRSYGVQNSDIWGNLHKSGRCWGVSSAACADGPKGLTHSPASGRSRNGASSSSVQGRPHGPNVDKLAPAPPTVTRRRAPDARRSPQ